MTHFTSPNHFIAFARKTLAKSEGLFDFEQLLPSESYVKELFPRQLADEFGLAAMRNPSLFEATNFYEWVTDHENVDGIVIDNEIAQMISQEFMLLVRATCSVSGVYSFWDRSNKPLYVGMSHDRLGKRMLQSFEQRFVPIVAGIVVRAIETKTASDAAVVEACYIALLKPELNQSGRYQDALTLKFEVPGWGAPRQCGKE